MENNYFVKLNNINVNSHTEKKGNLTYLSWAWAWAEVKKLHPDAFYTIYENSEGWNYFTDGRTGWVKTGVTINGLEHIEYLPIMDYKNKSMPLEQITSFNVNTSIQRSLTKACARHGLGLYIYAGEDLPEAEDEFKAKAVEKITAKEVQMLQKMFKQNQLDAIMAQCEIFQLEDMTAEQYANVFRSLNEKEKKDAKQSKTA